MTLRSTGTTWGAKCCLQPSGVSLAASNCARCARNSGLPGFVPRELYAYLDCGILANGFARVHCASCGRDELVAFSCKGRPS